MDETRFQDLENAVKAIFKAMDYLVDKFDVFQDLGDRLSSLEKTVAEDLIDPLNYAIDIQNKEESFNGFSEKYNDRFSKYNDEIKAIEGDEDFDLTKTIWEDYESLENKDISEEDFIDAYESTLVDKLNKLRKTLGVEEISLSVSEGEVVLEADGVEVPETKVEEVLGETLDEELLNKENQVETVDLSLETEEDEETEEDIKNFEEELEKFLPKK